MFFTSIEEQFRQSAREEFQQILRRSTLGTLWSTATGRSNRLLRLDEIRRNGEQLSRSEAGIQTVPIDQIRGSESRSADFDRHWRPLKYVNQARWTSIAVARLKGVSLPTVELIKVGDVYFVRDGHHRISVAKYQGQDAIEAHVIEWHGADVRVIPASAGNRALVHLLRPATHAITEPLSMARNYLIALGARAQRLLGRRVAGHLDWRQGSYGNEQTA